MTKYPISNTLSQTALDNLHYYTFVKKDKDLNRSVYDNKIDFLIYLLRESLWISE